MNACHMECMGTEVAFNYCRNTTSPTVVRVAPIRATVWVERSPVTCLQAPTGCHPAVWEMPPVVAAADAAVLVERASFLRPISATARRAPAGLPAAPAARVCVARGSAALARQRSCYPDLRPPSVISQPAAWAVAATLGR